MSGNIRRSRGRPWPRGIRGGIGQLLDGDFSHLGILGELMPARQRFLTLSHNPNGRTFDLLACDCQRRSARKTRIGHTPCSSQQQVVLQWLKLFLHCVGWICKWDGGGEVGFPSSSGYRGPRLDRNQDGFILRCFFYVRLVSFNTLFHGFSYSVGDTMATAT